MLIDEIFNTLGLCRCSTELSETFLLSTCEFALNYEIEAPVCEFITKNLFFIFIHTLSHLSTFSQLWIRRSHARFHDKKTYLNLRKISLILRCLQAVCTETKTFVRQLDSFILYKTWFLEFFFVIPVLIAQKVNKKISLSYWALWAFFS